MKLSVGERMVALSILPKENNFVTMKLIRGIVEKIGFKDEEFKEFDIKQDGDRVYWNSKKDTEKDIPFGEKETDIIMEALKELDKNKKITEQHYSLYEKFVDKK